MITKKYRGERILTLGKFIDILDKLPNRIPINFSGVCEPFSNPYTTDMILYAHKKGHLIIVFSTLVGLKSSDAIRLSVIPFEEFVLHMPDASGNSNIPLTQDYFSTLGIILYNIKNLSFMSMREPFVSNNAEKIAREEKCTIYNERVICFRHEIPNLNMMPNGNVYFCCICRGVNEKVGSIYENTYKDLVEKMKNQSIRMQNDKTSICHKCGYAIPYWRYQLRKINRCIHG